MRKPKPKHLQTQSDWASLKRLILRGSDACYLWRLCFFQTVRRHGLEHPRGIVDRRVTKSVKVWKSPEDLPRVIGRGLRGVSSRRIRWGLGVLSCGSETGCPGLCVLKFKYSAAPTRRTTETAVGTGLPNHCLHQAYWFYFLNSFISSFLCCAIVHICVWRLWLKTFSISSVQFLQSVCLHPVLSCVYASVLCACLHYIMMTMLVLCYVYFWVLIPLLVVLH